MTENDYATELLGGAMFDRSQTKSGRLELRGVEEDLSRYEERRKRMISRLFSVGESEGLLMGCSTSRARETIMMGSLGWSFLMSTRFSITCFARSKLESSLGVRPLPCSVLHQASYCHQA